MKLSMGKTRNNTMGWTVPSLEMRHISCLWGYHCYQKWDTGIYRMFVSETLWISGSRLLSIVATAPKPCPQKSYTFPRWIPLWKMTKDRVKVKSWHHALNRDDGIVIYNKSISFCTLLVDDVISRVYAVRSSMLQVTPDECTIKTLNWNVDTNVNVKFI